MKKGIILAAGMAILAMAGVSFAGVAAAPLSTPALKQTVGANGKATLVFFQNPNGGPCRMQKQIIDGLLQERKNGFNIAAISTMRQEDQKAFYDYGVRSLPSLVLVDRSGRIARVFPPGIQSREAVAAALDGLK